ncbi:heme-binding domain-containing protein [Granulicella sp. L60]|uniref:heme-binding domain-containing protein n=1 Tax=Granulicella sp. L60 TaxID=1641866 RepID=UPI00131AEA63|nr:heme-binding domain-containing protein [Granulicella sp. L60]
MDATSQTRFRGLAWTIAVLGLVFVGIQFLRPELTNPPVTAELQAPPEVMQVLKGSCYSCHSNETKLPWFDEVVPAYWIVTSDVMEARRHMNFSEMGRLPVAQQRGFLFEAVNMIQLGAMPLPAYTKVHPNAVVKPEQLAVLRNYLSGPPAPDAARTAQAAMKATADAAADNAEYGKWIQSSGPATNVQPEFNGVGFLPDYKNWKAISSTDRFDNHTMREILANDVAVKAIAENHINPWPDGSAFAKVTWVQPAPDEKGVVKAGRFVQTELMIKDSQKYSATEGWGWGRWRGMDLKPYGKDAAFQNECTSCHEPVAKNDYVYTMPLRGQQ